MNIDTIVAALTLQRAQIKGLAALITIAVAVSASCRLRRPPEVVPQVTALDTITPGVSPSQRGRIVTSEMLEEILNIKLPDTIYYFIPE